MTTREEIDKITGESYAAIVESVNAAPGLFSPASLVELLEAGEIGHEGVIEYQCAEGHTHQDPPAGVALWLAIGDGVIMVAHGSLYPVIDSGESRS